jgi:hypothetical protein
MPNILENRVRGLEAALLPQALPTTVIVVRFDAPQIFKLRALADGHAWLRQADEDEAGFIGRALDGMSAGAGVAVLIGT